MSTPPSRPCSSKRGHRRLDRRSLRPTGLIFLTVASIILVVVGHGRAWDQLERAAKWAENEWNSRVVQAVGVVSGVAFTSLLLLLTRRSIRVASDALAEAREARRKD